LLTHNKTQASGAGGIARRSVHQARRHDGRRRTGNFPETVKSDGARHMGSSVWVGLWVKGETEGEGEGERKREREATKHKQWLRERGGRAVCQRGGMRSSMACSTTTNRQFSSFSPEPTKSKPEPGTWNPKPETRNPESGTRNPEPTTRKTHEDSNQKPQTRSLKPET